MNIIYEKHDLYPESILIRKFIGKVSSTDIIDSWDYLCKNKLIDKKIKGVITDLLECELNLDMESFKTVLDYMEKQDRLKEIKCPVISNDPKTIIFPFLGEKHKSKLKIKPFSTIEAATNWISMNLL
ncbi:MAG: hypothetical protein QM478_04765 [Flavobacteriaceae bacterium]